MKACIYFYEKKGAGLFSQGELTAETNTLKNKVGIFFSVDLSSSEMDTPRYRGCRVDERSGEATPAVLNTVVRDFTRQCLPYGNNRFRHCVQRVVMLGVLDE